MDWKIFATVFVAVFIAELGDKTQIATMLFASGEAVSRWTVFFAASGALIAATGLGVLAGAALGELLNPHWLAVIAGIGFIAIGAWSLWRAVPALLS